MPQDKSKPTPHYTVLVQLKEVTPAVRVSGVVGNTERQVEDLISVMVRAKTAADAVEQAVRMLETYDGFDIDREDDEDESAPMPVSSMRKYPGLLKGNTE